MEQFLICAMGLKFLIVFSIIDVKTHKLNNSLVGIFFIAGILLSILTDNLLLDLAGMGIMTIFSLLLWNYGGLGGADIKLLIALVPFLDITNLKEVLHFMLILPFPLLLTLGVIQIRKKSLKKIKRIPFIPVITLSYLLFWIIKITTS